MRVGGTPVRVEATEYFHLTLASNISYQTCLNIPDEQINFASASFVKGALVRDLIADVEGETFIVFCIRESVLEAHVVETHVLKVNGAAAEPVILRHALDEQDFGAR
jgi:hypothetical protein